MTNSSSKTGSARASPSRDNLAAGISILVLAVPCLLMYALFLYVALKQKKLRKQSFLILSFHLAVADMMAIVLQIFYAAPSAILETEIGGESTNLVMGALLNISWFATNPLILLLGINRYVCICRPNLYDSWFNAKKGWILSFCAWTFSFIYSFASFFDCCTLYFYCDFYAWGWDRTKTGSIYFSYGELTIVATTVLIVYIVNVLVFRRIRQTHYQVADSITEQQAAQRRKRETRLFFQFFVISLWLLVFDTFFVTFGYIDSTKWHGLAVTLMQVVNSSINGWSFYLLNHSIRKEIILVFSKLRCRNSVMDAPVKRNLSDQKPVRKGTRLPWNKSQEKSLTLDTPLQSNVPQPHPAPDAGNNGFYIEASG